MAVVWKSHGERREELLDAALAMFQRLGYEGSSVAAIIDAVGVSKGTFYHYFSSKEELLDAIVLRMTEQIMEKVRTALSPRGMSAIERFNALIGASIQWKTARRDVIMTLLQALYRDENLRLRQKMNRRTRQVLLPYMIEILRQGLGERTFDTPDPEEAAEMFFNVAFSIGEGMANLILASRKNPDALVRLQRRLAHYQHTVERIFGVAAGQIRMVQDAQGFLQALAGEERPHA